MFAGPSRGMSPLLRLLSLFFATFCLTVVAANAQCNDNQHTASGAVGLGSGGQVYDRFSSAYQFEMYYDQSSTIYIVTEPLRNSDKLRWNGWCMDQQVKNLTASTLSDVSHTESFIVHTGDVVTVYRELCWRRPSGAYDHTYCYAEDTLDYVIEIADAVTGERLALLDSIGLLPRMPAGPPTFYGTAANAARLSWVVPLSFDGQSVVIGIRLGVRGNGQYDPGRLDRMTVNLSDRLTDAASQAGIIQPH